MRFLAFPILALVSLSSEPPWSDLTLAIEIEAGYSSDQVAVCRVRVVNHGAHTWPGRSLHFEARALDGGVVVERVRGRFGLSLPPGGTLETLVGFSAPYTRFEVAPAAASDGGGTRKRASGKSGKTRKRSKPGKPRPPK
jgi:hypothetical protein